MTLYYLLSDNLNEAVIIFAFGEIFLVILPEYIIRPRIVLIGASIHPVITILAFKGPNFLDRTRRIDYWSDDLRHCPGRLQDNGAVTTHL